MNVTRGTSEGADCTEGADGAAGLKLLRLAERILPEIDATEAEFAAIRQGRAGRLHIAIECHACFDWLFPVLEGFRRVWPDIDIDIRPGPLPRNPNGKIDRKTLATEWLEQHPVP